MRIFLFLMFFILYSAISGAEQICNYDSIPASIPNSQLIDNGDNTITDSETGLMWKKCLEGLGGNKCENGSTILFTWQTALQQPIIVNDSGGFAGHTDWRLPNIRELLSIVEEQCSEPAINIDRFPNTSWFVWSGSPDAGNTTYAWFVYFKSGGSYRDPRHNSYAVRLVRGGY